MSPSYQLKLASDIGSVVFPDADIKIFLTADPGIRAQRRYDEMIAKGLEVDYEQVRDNIMDRDHQDYYLDAEGYVIPAVRGYAPHILLANGYIDSKDLLLFQDQWHGSD